MGMLPEQINRIVSEFPCFAAVSNDERELTLYRVRNGEVCVIMMASILRETGYEAFAETEGEFTESGLGKVTLLQRHHWALLVAASTRSGAILSHGVNALIAFEEGK
jgi:hypothetical protein